MPAASMTSGTEPATSGPVARAALVVGRGRAGELHLGALLRLRQEAGRHGEVPVSAIFATDVDDARATGLPDGVEWIRSDQVDHLHRVEPASAIVHVCTPPTRRSSVIERYAALGFRRFIVEKPLATSVAEVQCLRTLRDECALEIYVVGNWLVSDVTARLIDILGAPGRRLLELHVTQLKPRLQRSLRGDGDETVFDVEMPHSIGLAARVAGYPMELLEASGEDLIVGGRRFRLLRTGTVQVDHPSGVRTTVYSDLSSPLRQRTVRAICNDVSVRADYPVSSQDQYGQIQITDSEGRSLLHDHVWDDSFGRMFEEAYTDWWGSEVLRENFDLSAAVVEVIAAAPTLATASTVPHELEV